MGAALKVEERSKQAGASQDFAVLYSMLEQDMAAVLRARELGIDPCDFARVFIERRDGGVILHVITSGDEGEAAFKAGLNSLMKVEEFKVSHAKVRRYAPEDLFDRLIGRVRR